jgi:predicted aldo/keto reductase-like oxidoreductase
MFGINMLRHGEEEKVLIQACVDRGVGLVVMKPYFGGTLLFVDGQPTPNTPTQCLAYVLSLPVSTTVPGVKNAAEMRATLRYCQATEAEKDYRPALANVHQYLEGHCVYCNHCLPCPQDINIATTILSTDWAQGGLNDELRAAYASLPVKASACTECGDCLARCPFGVDVIARMRQAVEVFEASIAEQRVSHE